MEIANNQLSPRQKPSGPSLSVHLRVMSILYRVNKRRKKGEDRLWVSVLLRCRAYTGQRAKKVVSDSPGLVDFAIRLVNFVLTVTCPIVK